MDHRDHDGPSWTQSSHTCAISSTALFIPLDGKNDGPSQAQRSLEGLRSKTLQLLESGYWITSLNFTTNLQDGPSKPRRTVTSFVTHTWSDFPIFLQQLNYAATYGPSQARWTVISSVGVLLCISLLKIFAFNFGQISCKTKRNLYKNQHKKAFGHTKLKEKVLIIP